MKAHFRLKTRPKGKQSCDAGFTLIEVLIALTVFAVGLLALAGMQMTGIQGNSTAQVVSTKNALASGVVDEWLAMDPTDPRLAANGTFEEWISEVVEGAGLCVADVVIEVNPVIDGTTYNGLSLIRVTVSSPRGADLVQTVVRRRL